VSIRQVSLRRAARACGHCSFALPLLLLPLLPQRYRSAAAVADAAAIRQFAN